VALNEFSNLADIVGHLFAEYPTSMSTVQEIEEAVRRLSPDEQASFRAWYAEFDAEEWDRHFETDVAAGRLDWLIAEARQDRREGRCTDR